MVAGNIGTCFECGKMYRITKESQECPRCNVPKEHPIVECVIRELEGANLRKTLNGMLLEHSVRKIVNGDIPAAAYKQLLSEVRKQYEFVFKGRATGDAGSNALAEIFG